MAYSGLQAAHERMGLQNEFKYSDCIFVSLIMLSTVLCISDIATGDPGKYFQVVVLIFNIILMMVMVANYFGISPALTKISSEASLFFFFVVLILTLILSILDLADDVDTDKTLAIFTLVISSVLTLVAGYFTLQHMKTS